MFYNQTQIMAERLVTPEILQTRSDAIIKGIQRAIDNGLNPSKLREIEINQRSKLHHRELLGVSLGLKPLFAEFGPQGTPSVYGTYSFSSFPQEKDKGIETSWHNGFVWNPAMVNTVFQGHKELIPDNVYVNPYNKKWFSNLLASLQLFASEPNAPEQANVLLGLLYGYPKEAARLFSKYGVRVGDDMDKIYSKAHSSGRKLSWKPPISTLQLAENTSGVRDDLARLTQLPEFAPEELGVDKEVIDYALLVRNADIPYFPFATIMNRKTGNHITHDEEAKMRREYETSRMDEKLNRLLSSIQ